MLHSGIYEQVIDRHLAKEFDHIPENRKATASIEKDQS